MNRLKPTSKRSKYVLASLAVALTIGAVGSVVSHHSGNHAYGMGGDEYGECDRKGQQYGARESRSHGSNMMGQMGGNHTAMMGQMGGNHAAMMGQMGGNHAAMMGQMGGNHTAMMGQMPNDANHSGFMGGMSEDIDHEAMMGGSNHEYMMGGDTDSEETDMMAQ